MNNFVAQLKKHLAILRWAVMTIVFSSIVGWVAGPYWQTPARIVALDVGQGDAILLQDGHGNDCLVDGGQDNTVLEAMSQFVPPWDRTLECVVITHADADHITGLFALSQRYTIERLYWNGENREILKPILERAEQAVVVNKGDQWILGTMHFHVLSAFNGSDDRNENSVVLLVESQNATALLTGDASKEIEQQLDAPDIDILKAGHHGSNTSTSWQLLQKTTPEIVIISAGSENRYGHPHEDVLARLKQIGATILRTDKAGSIEIPF